MRLPCQHVLVHALYCTATLAWLQRACYMAALYIETMRSHQDQMEGSAWVVHSRQSLLRAALLSEGHHAMLPMSAPACTMLLMKQSLLLVAICDDTTVAVLPGTVVMEFCASFENSTTDILSRRSMGQIWQQQHHLAQENHMIGLRASAQTLRTNETPGNQVMGFLQASEEHCGYTQGRRHQHPAARPGPAVHHVQQPERARYC